MATTPSNVKINVNKRNKKTQLKRVTRIEREFRIHMAQSSNQEDSQHMDHSEFIWLSPVIRRIVNIWINLNI
uniref:Uncharacterized protein n=1 Tax=Setaria viridis TaxID=4556 RepID=A0A4U6V802_SETVI|nr:hypothetical protein SEVIR_4G272002v2 [Setaria viridis]